MLAMDVNDNACCLNQRVVLEFFASMPQAGTRSYRGQPVKVLSRCVLAGCTLWRRSAGTRSANHSL